MSYVPQVLLPYSRLPDDQLREIQRADAAGHLESVRLDPRSVAVRLAWPEHHLLRARVLRSRETYGALFPLSGLNEALYSAVRWNRKGLYRSRWGNYDLISNAGYVAASSNSLRPTSWPAGCKDKT